MAYKDFSSGTSGQLKADAAHNSQTLSIHGDHVQVPDASFVKDAHITKDGINLVLEGPHGTVVIQGYFAADPQPSLVAPDGSTLTPQLVESFTKTQPQYAENLHAADISPVGTVHEVSGHATVTHKDGTVVTAALGTPIFEGDIIETDTKGAVNISFIDQTTFAVSEDARLAIDKYVFDPKTEAGQNDFSILKGVFVFTSGLIGRDDPDSVHIQTPAGSIGIRGTIIAGNVHTGEITVVEGAIVLHDFQGHEVTLASQYETARFNPTGGTIEHVGQLSANDVSNRFSSVAHVSPTLFSSINDSAHDAPAHDGGHDGNNQPADAKPDAPAPAADVHSDAAPAPVAPPPAPMGNFGTAGTFASATLGSSNTSSFGPPPVNGPAPTAPAQFNVGLPPVTGPNLPPPPAGTAANDPNHFINPNQPPPPPTGPVDHAPVHFLVGNATESFWVAEGGFIHYNFAQEFKDQDISSGDSLHYQLSASTIALFNSLTNDGAGPNLDVLQTAQGTGLDNLSDQGKGWAFNTGTGDLTLYMGPNFDAAVGAVKVISIDVYAMDSHGLAAGTSVNVVGFDVTGGNHFTGTYNADSTVFTGFNASPTTLTLTGDNNKFFIENGTNHNDTVFIDNTGTGNTGSNNTVNLGGGDDTVQIYNDAFGNRVIGGEGNDTFNTQTAQVAMFGGEGDDTFILDFAGGGNIQTDLTSGLAGFAAYGGSNAFRQGLALQALGMNVAGSTGGRGDTLMLAGAGTLDFSTIHLNNQIRGIERIDLATNGAGQHAILNYNDIVLMNGSDSTLVINVGNGDTLDLNGAQMAGMRNAGPLANNLSVDDGAEGTPNVQAYDVYTDGHVTLMIHADGGATVNMDGVGVNIAA